MWRRVEVAPGECVCVCMCVCVCVCVCQRNFIMTDLPTPEVANFCN